MCVCALVHPAQMAVEVLNSRVERRILVIEAKFVLNLLSLTLDKVLSKRRNVVADMCVQLADKTRAEARRSDAWAALRAPESDAVPAAVEAFLAARLMPLAARAPQHYNDNKPLGSVIQEAVAVAEILTGWPDGLRAVAKETGVTIEGLMSSEGRLDLSFNRGEPALAVVHGLCALMWGCPRVRLSVSARHVGADGLCALAMSMATNLTSLDLQESDCANNGGDNHGILQLCIALEHQTAGPGLLSLNVARNSLGPAAGKALAHALSVNAVLTSLNISDNKLDSEAGKALASMLEVNAVLTNLNVAVNQLTDEGGKALAEALRVNAVLTSLDLSDNQLCGDYGSIFCGNSDLDVTGIYALASSLKVNAALTSLDLHDNQIPSFMPNASVLWEVVKGKKGFELIL
jgi:hypothetical protein